jgi:mono/diheme cytochrome c family protein
MRRLLLSIGAVVLGTLGAIQLVPYGRDHINPQVTQESRWDSARTRALAARACFDCHSNETVWPWYSNVAPVSWLIQRDVDEGRRALPATSAHLAPDERAQLMAGLQTTFGAEKTRVGERRRKKDDD